MLQIIKVVPTSGMRVEVDHYVPLTIRFNKYCNNIYPTNYWMTGDFTDNLLEIGLTQESNTLGKIIIPFIKNITKAPIIEIDQFPVVFSGVPVFSKKYDHENNYIIEEKGPLQMTLDSNHVFVLFSDNEIQSKIVSNQVTFLLDKDNNFCGFEVADLTNEQVQMLDAYYEEHVLSQENS